MKISHENIKDRDSCGRLGGDLYHLHTLYEENNGIQRAGMTVTKESK